MRYNYNSESGQMFVFRHEREINEQFGEPDRNISRHYLYVFGILENVQTCGI